MMLKKVLLFVLIIGFSILPAGLQDEPAQEPVLPENWYAESPMTIAGMSVDEYQSWLETSGQISAFEKLSKRGAIRVRSEKQLKRYGATPEIIALLKKSYGDDLNLPGKIWWDNCDGWYCLSGWCYCVDTKDKWDYDCECSDVVPISSSQTGN